MKYKITRAICGQQPSIELTYEEYAHTLEAKRNLWIFLGIEEKLDLLLQNYAEYERTLLDLALHQMICRDLDWSSFRADIQLVNRRLTNLFSAARLYVDQIKHDLGAVYGQGSEMVSAIKKELSKQYDASLGYRAMEAIRNHIQHRSLVVHRMSYPSRLENPKVPGGRVRYSIVPSLDTAELEKDRDVKGSVLNELRDRGRYVPLTPLVREYIEGLAHIHEVLREMTSADTSVWEAALENVQRRAVDVFGENLDGLSVVAKDEAGRYPEIEAIFDDMGRRRQSLVRRNCHLERLANRYVSGEADEHEA
jgi:hypothetical protein